jgi:hypothetical protein
LLVALYWDHVGGGTLDLHAEFVLFENAKPL